MLFEDYELGWAGETHVIPASMRMRAIAAVEEHITLNELYAMMKSGKAPIARLASAYASVLRLIGINISDEELYGRVFVKGQTTQVVNALMGLISLMLPPSSALKGVTLTEGKQKAQSNSSK